MSDIKTGHPVVKPLTDEELAELDLYLTGAIDINEWFPPKRVMALRERLRLAEAACQLMCEWNGNDSDFVEIDQALVAWKRGVKRD